MKHISLMILLATLIATPALARKYMPDCIPSPSQDAPPCDIKNEPGALPSLIKDTPVAAPDVEAVKQAPAPVATPAPPPVPKPVRARKARAHKKQKAH
jgi:hypothetical protein